MFSFAHFAELYETISTQITTGSIH